MKIISHAKLTKGYEHWKQAFDENESLRQEYGVTVLAYGHPKENKDEIYTVLQVESMERNARNAEFAFNGKIKNRSISRS